MRQVAQGGAGLGHFLTSSSWLRGHRPRAQLGGGQGHRLAANGSAPTRRMHRQYGEGATG
ncbi:hypothetical protein TOK_3250 [Pseudonocardia sp. N23]|nr:hypothetical protein TOK_3250 [Pseudonocardia sp. N23]